MSRIGFKLFLTGFFGLWITACTNNSIERDARQIADLQCRSYKLQQRAAAGDMSLMQESAALSTQAMNLMRQLEGKYALPADRQLLLEAVGEAMKDCQ